MSFQEMTSQLLLVSDWRTPEVPLSLPGLMQLLCGQFALLSRLPPPVSGCSAGARRCSAVSLLSLRGSFRPLPPPLLRPGRSLSREKSNIDAPSQQRKLCRVMPSNMEIKAKVSDPTQFAKKAAELSQSEGTIIRQHDTFFNCSQGRLKLRDFMNGSGQLIFYERPDTDGPKLSRYSISPTSDPLNLQTVLSDALGVRGEVVKERRLFLIGQTRVHLDKVEGLGHYMELEVVMKPEQTVEDGQQVAEGLMQQLGVSKESLVTGAYMDLLLKGQKEA
uniref:Si:ch211-156b7.4 n=1 Tax=Amphiprion percula TaxID=161767 RepID=A0A3P8U6B8_AMPPE